MSTSKLHLGFDVHKGSITLANAPSTPPREVRLLGTITNDLHALERTVTRLREAHPHAHLEGAYEAGPCGFGIARRLQQLGVPCVVAAPFLIPRKPGAPFKTDPRDLSLSIIGLTGRAGSSSDTPLRRARSLAASA
jgi:transposase